MENITRDNVNDFTVSGVWSIAGTFKADDTSDEKKSFTLNVKFDNVPVVDIINSAIGSQPTKVQWCNANRKRFDEIDNKAVINVDFKSPGRMPQVDPKTALVNEAKGAGVDVTDKQAFSAWLKERFNI